LEDIHDLVVIAERREKRTMPFDELKKSFNKSLYNLSTPSRLTTRIGISQHSQQRPPLMIEFESLLSEEKSDLIDFLEEIGRDLLKN